jgi:hypothetical protein
MSGAYGPQRSSVLVRIAGLVFGLLATGLQLAEQSAPGSLQGVVTARPPPLGALFFRVCRQSVRRRGNLTTSSSPTTRLQNLRT